MIDIERQTHGALYGDTQTRKARIAVQQGLGTYSSFSLQSVVHSLMNAERDSEAFVVFCDWKF